MHAASLFFVGGGGGGRSGPRNGVGREEKVLLHAPARAAAADTAALGPGGTRPLSLDAYRLRGTAQIVLKAACDASVFRLLAGPSSIALASPHAGPLSRTGCRSLPGP